MHGRARGRRIKKKSSKPGTAFIHHALDDHSRLTYSEILDDERNETVCAFWQRANAYFASCGITVKRVLTDNGSAYRSRQFADTLGPITHKRTRPYRPRTNGNVERFNRTQEQEWAYAHPYRTESEGVAAFPAFLHTYNHHRGHTTLHGAASRPRSQPLRAQHLDHLARRRATPAAARRHLAGPGEAVHANAAW